MSYGVELSGSNASWSFETGGLRIRYGTGMSTHALLKALGETVVADAALAGVRVATGRRKAVLQLDIRPGADPLLEAAAGQLPDEANPYRLVLDAGDKNLAEYYAGALEDRIAMNPHAAKPAEEFLVSGPPPPRTLRGYDGQGTFDGATVDFRWAWSGATSRKWAAGHQSFPIETIEGVEWVAGGVLAGHLRLKIAGRTDPQKEAEHDPAALIFGLGYGLIAESLPFAASVLAAVGNRTQRSRGPRHSAEPEPEWPEHEPSREQDQAQPSQPELAPVETKPLATTADEIFNAIRQLGELRAAGVLTETEFEQKKAELLSRL